MPKHLDDNEPSVEKYDEASTCIKNESDAMQ